MYQSNRSFNIPAPGQPPGHLNFWHIFVEIPPSPGRKAVQMPHSRENYQITVSTFPTPLHATSHLFKEN